MLWVRILTKPLQNIIIMIIPWEISKHEAYQDNISLFKQKIFAPILYAYTLLKYMDNDYCRCTFPFITDVILVVLLST